MAEKPRACILTGFGINCEQETAHALEMAGARCELVHFNKLQADGGEALGQYQIFMLPGGWAFADDIQSGRVLANKFRFKLQEPLRKFIDSGKPVVGICNGFQVLAQLGALPGWDKWESRELTLMTNRNGRFENRWVRLRTEASACPFAQDMDLLTLPVRHGEGQMALASPKTLDKLEEGEQIVFRYASARDGLKADSYPDNPNGSADAIAGICNEAGNVMGMMPHPECHVRYLQSPNWTERPPKAQEKGGFLSSLSSMLGAKEKAPQDAGNCRALFEGIVESAKKF